MRIPLGYIRSGHVLATYRRNGVGRGGVNGVDMMHAFIFTNPGLFFFSKLDINFALCLVS